MGKKNLVQHFIWNEQDWAKKRYNGFIMFFGGLMSVSYLLSGHKWTSLAFGVLTIISMFNARFKEDVIDRTMRW